MFDFSFLPFGNLRSWKHCLGFHNKITSKKDTYQDLIDSVIKLVQEDDVIHKQEGQSSLSDCSLDWYDVSPEISVNTETKDSTASSGRVAVEPEQNVFKPPSANISNLISPAQHSNLEVKQSLAAGEEVKQQEKDGQAPALIDSPPVDLNYVPFETNGSESSISRESTSLSTEGVRAVASVRSVTFNISPEKMTRSQNDHQSICNDQKNRKRLSNRLDVSKLNIRAALAVVVEERGWKQNGSRTKRVFDNIYETLGKNRDKIIDVVIEENCIKIYTENQETRLILFRELKEMNQLIRQTSPYQLYIQNPLKPSIQFLCCTDTYKMSNCDLIAQIRSENNWDSEWTVNIESKEWIRKLRKAKLSLIIDSRIRDKIELEDGIIYVAGKETKVFDKFGISQCSVCLRFGHSKCRSRVRCFFCSGYHPDRYRHDKYIEKRYCFLCRVDGHAPISKNCPTLIEELRFKLELIDYEYKEIFVGTDRSY